MLKVGKVKGKVKKRHVMSPLIILVGPLLMHGDAAKEKERENLDRMLEDHKKSLYPGCDNGLKKLGCTLDLLKWKAQADMASSINFNQFLEKEKLKSNGSNFTDWFRHVRIFLNGGNLQYVLDAPLVCHLMQSGIRSSKRFEHHDPHELIKELKTIFETHAAVECYEASKHFFSCMMEEGSSIEHEQGVSELFGMLKAAEIEIKKEHQVLMVNKTTSFKKQGKSKGKNKKSGKKAATPPGNLSRP
ncbi:hypothetical protein QYE76_039791 [Lolium multiflorum]|uniref:Uncharacterized protein n=1 Tax=Lolium multiflorum TaxID=4521 RepID=A0AAD8TBL4_LOLMU|nr:hypothetical protein QYE76_039791 [Lolium multiflorum]